MDKKIKIYQRLVEHFGYVLEQGFEVVFVALQGSQNYDLDIYEEDYKSDIDSKAVILPSFEDFVHNKTPVSTTLKMENDEQIDVKDVRIMFENYKKQNINYIETLFSKYVLFNPKYKQLVQPLFDNNEKIAHLNTNQAIRCMAGMSKEKLKALKHPYPTIVDKINKYGYDPKQLHHILRINDFIFKYALLKKPYKECLIPINKEYLIDIKKGFMPEEYATKLAIRMDEDTNRIKDASVKMPDHINEKAIDILNKVKFDLLKKRFKEELEGD